MGLTAKLQEGGGGILYTSNNGLTLTGTNFQLGGTLIQATFINKNNNGLFIIGAGDFLARTQSGDEQSNVATSAVGSSLQYTNTATGLTTEYGNSSLLSYMLFQGATGSNIKNTISAKATGLYLYTNLNTTAGQGLAILNGGQLNANKYGLGAFTGTPAYNLVTDAAGNIIEAALGGGGGTASSLVIKVLQSDFASATAYNNPLIVGKSLAIFMNSINRYLEDDEWSATATGIQILIPGFNATTDIYTFYITTLN